MKWLAAIGCAVAALGFLGILPPLEAVIIAEILLFAAVVNNT
jgi:hypothetical protein